MRRSTSGTKEKGHGENGGATNQGKTHSVLISCAIDQVREHCDLCLFITTRALRGGYAPKV
jgi:hypothetical protein